MINKTSNFIFLALLFITPTLTFAETKVITLKDGSQIKGELTNVANGVYTIKTPLMGDVKISDSQVVSIATNAPIATLPALPTTLPATTNPSNVSSAELNQKMQTMQTKLMSNPEFVADLQKMAQDPELMRIISDPELLQAVTSKDVNAIQGNPRTKQLIDNPKIKALIQKLQANGVDQ